MQGMVHCEGKLRMHILVIPSWYPKTLTDVSGSFFREQALALKRYGHKVGVIFPQKKSIRNLKNLFNHQYGTEQQDDFGVKTFRYHYLARFPWVQRANTWLWVHFGLLLFRKYIQVYGKPDVIHAHSLLDGGLLAYKINKYYQIPFVVTEHRSYFYHDDIKKWQRDLSVKIINKASVCMAVSMDFSSSLTDMFENSNKKWIFVPNMLGFNFQETTPGLLINKSDRFQFCSVSLLTKNKGVDILLRAFSKSFGGQNNIRLVIGGDGEERKSLETLALDLNISRQVSFYGLLSRQQVCELMMQSQVCVLASYIETFGMVLIESLALGKPVIATRCGGPESIVREQDGILISTNDDDVMAVAMKQIYDNYLLYDPSNIRASCINRFGEKVVVKQLNNIYENIVLSPPELEVR